MHVSIKLIGGEKIARRLQGMTEKLARKKLQSALEEGAELFRERASELAPREPGAPDLADNIGISALRGSGLEKKVAVGPTKGFYYGSFQEFGTRYHAAQPFMRPAFDEEGEKAILVISNALGAEVHEAAK